MCLLAPRHLLGRISDKDLILLSASPDVRVGTVEGSGVQGEETWVKHHKRSGEVNIGRGHEVQRLYGNYSCIIQ